VRLGQSQPIITPKLGIANNVEFTVLLLIAVYGSSEIHSHKDKGSKIKIKIKSHP